MWRFSSRTRPCLSVRKFFNYGAKLMAITRSAKNKKRIAIDNALLEDPSLDWDDSGIAIYRQAIGDDGSMSVAELNKRRNKKNSEAKQ